MQFENIILEKQDQVATIRMNRPKELNALNFGLFADIVKALELCADDGDTKAVILTGTGKAFSSGGDVVLFKDSEDRGDTLRQLTKLLSPVISYIRRIPKPVIAMINGVTAGAGVSLAVACDLRISAASAKFRQAYTSVGLVPDGAWSLLVSSLVGFGKASELIFLDPIFGADQALEYGLVNRVVADDELEDVTRDIALRLANGPSVAFAIAKDNLNTALFGLLDRQLERERMGMVRVGRTFDSGEGVSAILEKRKPQFKGQ